MAVTYVDTGIDCGTETQSIPEMNVMFWSGNGALNQFNFFSDRQYTMSNPECEQRVAFVNRHQKVFYSAKLGTRVIRPLPLTLRGCNFSKLQVSRSTALLEQATLLFSDRSWKPKSSMPERSIPTTITLVDRKILSRRPSQVWHQSTPVSYELVLSPSHVPLSFGKEALVTP